ncbi:MAG: hypothetical protein K2H43_04275, partial [Clostridia bacterium]|nr:hypothetical protein [Clostridia bacterium]
MDAKITKQRLGNLLAYDWLKILAAIAAAAVLLSLFFTMVRTRPTEGQKFEVHAYTDVTAGVKFHRLSDELLDKSAFSYDILAVSQEAFTVSGSAAGQVYAARRAAGEGSVLFITDVPEYDDEGKLKQESMLKSLSEGILSTEKGKGAFYDVRYYMECSRRYLAEFFGENLTGELDEEAAKESFFGRNSGDKRF